MDTIIVYISDKRKIPENFRCLVETEMSGCVVCFLTYQKIDEPLEKENIVDTIYERLGIVAADLGRWQLLLIRDLREQVEADLLYGENFDLWELLDYFNREGNGWKHKAAAPLAVYVVTTLDQPADPLEGTEIKKCPFRGMPWNPLCPIRLFAYNYTSGDGERYDRKEAMFWLAMAGFIAGREHPDEYHYDSIYWIHGNWDDRAASFYMKQMKALCLREQEEIDASWEAQEDTLPVNLLADGTEPSHDIVENERPEGRAGKKERKYNTAREVELARNELNLVIDRTKQSAREEFQKIRAATYYWDESVEWDEEIIDKSRRGYERALENLYQEGIMDETEVNRRLNQIQELANIKNEKASLQLTSIVLQTVIAFGFLITMLLFQQLGWDMGQFLSYVVGNGFWIVYVSVIILLCIAVLHFVLKRKSDGRRERRELDLVWSILKTAKDRIELELSHMANYRQAWHKQYDLQKHRELVNSRKIELVEAGKKIEERINLVDRLAYLTDQGKVAGGETVPERYDEGEMVKLEERLGEKSFIWGSINEMITIRQMMCRKRGAVGQEDELE